MNWRSSTTVTLGVVALHASLVAVALMRDDSITMPELPVMQVVMVSEQPPPTVEKPPEPRPQPKEPPPPPPPPAPPSENAIDDPPPPPPEPVAPPPTPAPAEPVVTPPKVNQAHGSVPPIVYPQLSRRLNETGRVMLNMHVLADGSIGEVRILRSSGFPRLDKAAVDAARKWRLTPARRGNEPIAMWYECPVDFQLTQ